MAWIIVSANGEELERRELRGPVVVGRSAECDVAVRDVLLSRTHCRIEPLGRGGWRVVDLKSKNGTHVGWQKLQVHVLRDGDHLRMGRTRVQFLTGEFEPATSKKAKPDRLVRPADPHEALTGTVTDFVLLDEEDGPENVDPFYADRPFPQPRPMDPASYGEAVTQTLLDDLAAAQQTVGQAAGGAMVLAAPPRTRGVARALPKFPKMAGGTIYREIRQAGAAEVDFSLQAEVGNLPVEEAAVVVKRGWAMARVGVGVALLVGTAVVLVSAWVLTLA